MLAQPTPESQSDKNETVDHVSFEDYINDASKVKIADRKRYILAASYGVVKDFNVTSTPYSNQSNRYLPTNNMMKQEILRQVPNYKGSR